MPDTAPVLPWAPEALQQALEPLLPGVQVQALASVDSTNTRLLERARGPQGLTPCLMVAEAQHQGRGRNGRAWASAPGASLTFSLALPLAPRDWSGLSLAVGAAVADALEPPAAGAEPRLQIKWPNDLWLTDAAPGQAPHWRKLAGILIETVAAAGERVCVVGIGINVRPQSAEGLSSGYACVQEWQPDATAPALLACVAPAVAVALRRFEAQGLAPFAEAFARRDLLRGRPVGTTLAAVPQGVAEGIDAQGALRVRVGDQLHAVSSGEVSVRPLESRINPSPEVA